MASFGAARLLTGKKSEKQLYGVCGLPDSDLALLSLNSEIVLLQPYDGKIIRSWNCASTKDHKLTSSTVFSEEYQEFVIVQNKTTLRTFSSTSFEHTETYTVKHPVHCLATIPFYEPIVFFQDGSVFHLAHVLEDPKNVSPNRSVPVKVEEILSVNLSVRNDGKLLVLSVCKVKNGYALLAAIMSPEDDNVYYLHAPIERRNCNIIEVTALNSAGTTSFAAIWSDGSLTKLNIYVTSQFLNVEVNEIAKTEVNDESSIVAVSEDQVIVLSPGGNLSLIDMKFGSVLEKITVAVDIRKIYFLNNIIYLDTPTSVQKIHFVPQRVTLAKALMKRHNESILHVPHYSNWAESATEVALFTQKDQDLVAVLLNTKQDTNFDKSWMKLWKDRSEKFQKELCKSHAMRNVLARFGLEDEKKHFWPSATLRKIISTGFINGSWCNGVISQLLHKEDWDFAFECITKLTDIPEQLILKFVTSLIDRSSTRDADAMEGEVLDLQLPEKVSSCLNELLQLPYTELEMRDEITTMPFSAVQNFILYLTKLFEEMSLASSKPTLNQVICWLSLLIDAHFSEIAMLESSWPTIERLQKAMKLHSAIFKELTAISRILTQIECRMPDNNKKRSRYTVEIMRF